MSNFPEPILIDVDEILREAQQTPRCPDCFGGVSILITGQILDSEPEWEVGRSHEMTCPSLSPELRAQCVADDTDQ